MRDLLVVIVNYRVAERVLDCLAELARQIPGHPGCRVVVVDNASGDGSAERIGAAIAERGWRGWVRLLASPRNVGYAAGNNLALREALADPGAATDLVWLLNPDTLPRPGALAELCAFLAAHPEVGIAGSRLEDADGTQHQSRYLFPSLASELEARLGIGVASRLLARWRTAQPLVPASHEVGWVAGASMLIRREVFEEVGLLDEGYFLYFEETDFCLRARRAGWRCWYVYESRVAHLASHSTGIDHLGRTRRMPGYWFESRRRYFVRNHGLVRAALIDAVALAAVLVGTLRERIQGLRGRRPPRQLGDLAAHCVFARPRAAWREARERLPVEPWQRCAREPRRAGAAG
jgi:hypothetical protein